MDEKLRYDITPEGYVCLLCRHVEQTESAICLHVGEHERPIREVLPPELKALKDELRRLERGAHNG